MLTGRTNRNGSPATVGAFLGCGSRRAPWSTSIEARGAAEKYNNFSCSVQQF